jgi:hypothetical protein
MFKEELTMMNFIKYFIQGIVTTVYLCVVCLGSIACYIIEHCLRGRLKKSEQSHPLTDKWAEWCENIYDVLERVGLLAEDF